MIGLTRQSQLDGLRELADYLESHPDVPMPYIHQFDAFVQSLSALQDAARAMGDADKVVIDDWFFLRRKFSGGVELHINISREKICKRVQVGERTVSLPAQEALPARQVTEPVYEYQCPESILGPSKGG